MVTSRSLPQSVNAMNIRTFQPKDEAAQVSIYNEAASSLPGFKAATPEDVAKRTGAEGFDPTTRFYAEEAGQVVGYCTLEPDQGANQFPVVQARPRGGRFATLRGDSPIGTRAR